MSRTLRRTRARGTPCAASPASPSCCEALGEAPRLGNARGAEHTLERGLAHDALVGEPHAERRQHPGERMAEDVLDAERVRHLAGVLAACATEALQGVARHVIAARHGDALDGVRHAADRDAQRTRSGLLRGR